MSRYLSEPFIWTAINRGKAVGQLLSYRLTGDQFVIRWVQLRRDGSTIEARLHEVVDPRDDDLLDIWEFPPLDESEYIGEGTPRPLESLDAAIHWIESELGGSRERFVNAGVLADEVADARERWRT